MAGIVMSFRGTEYRIPEEKAFAVAEEVEDIVKLTELMEFVKSPNFRRLARCYGVMLRHAGAKVSDDDVYIEMMTQVFSRGSDVEAAKTVLATQAVGTLFAVLFDGVPVGGGGAAPGKPNAS